MNEPSIYQLRHDDERFGLKAGDLLECRPHGWPWSVEKVIVVRRVSDGYEPQCSQYREDLRLVSGPRV